LLAKYGLTARNIVDAVKALLNKKGVYNNKKINK
jgi:hypothetical protein